MDSSLTSLSVLPAPAEPGVPSAAPALPAPAALGRDEWGELLAVVADAAWMWPPLYLMSFFGRPSGWLPPHRPWSEFSVLDVWRLQRAVQYVLDVTVAGVAAPPPPFGPPLLNHLIWRPSVILQRPDHNGTYTSYPDEVWFFVNGILTNDGLAQLNAAYLADLFHRPVTIVQNSTGGLVADLAECALGKGWLRTTESVSKAFPAIYDALKRPDKARVVVVAHSQGTIIMSVVLRLLAESLAMEKDRGAAREPSATSRRERLARDWRIRLDEFEPIRETELAKLEIYCMANCAGTMTFVAREDPGAAPIPWIESFGNEHDIVARLGMLAPQAESRGIDISGPRYVSRGAWGHLLDDHYLAPIDESQREGHRRGGRGGTAPFELVNANAPHEPVPRLFGYLNGGTPPRRSDRA